MKSSQYGPCGLFCGACGATDCGGCHSDYIDDYIRKCTFRNCAQEKNIDFCCSCDVYPCEKLSTFMKDQWPHHWTIEPNLKFIKENGVEKWLVAQRQEWTCNECGKEIVWYQKECECGKKFNAFKIPE